MRHALCSMEPTAESLRTPPPQGMTQVHSFDLAMEIFRRIGEVYPVSLRLAD